MYRRFIDGYNILFTMKKGRVGNMDAARTSFIGRVERLSKAQKLFTTLVFDGSRGDGGIVMPRERKGEWLELIFTGPDESADDAIMNFVEDIEFVDKSLVVTSDREIISHCKAYHARIQRAMSFIEELDEADVRIREREEEGIQGNEKVSGEKGTGKPREGVEFWMDYFKADIEE